MKPEALVSFCTIDSPIGRLTLTSDGTALTGLYMAVASKPLPRTADWVMDPSVTPLPEAVRQLREYFAGERQKFDLPLRMQGTEFQKRVWKSLLDIPAGQTSTYTEIAKKIGSPKAIRAVGNACSINNLAFAVPCHRVLHKDGSLSGGHHWGDDRQREMINREAGLQSERKK